MSRESVAEDQSTKTPFYTSEQKQDKPVGYLYLDGDTLVLEFPGTHPDIRLKSAKANLVEIVNDSSIRIELPDNPGKRIRLYLPADGKGRFAVYSIREWTGIDGTEPRAVRKRAFLARFDSIGAKVVALWQLALPYAIFGTTFLLDSFVAEPQPNVAYFVAEWQWLALTPFVAVHYALLLIPAVAILFFNRLWGLRLMFQMSLFLVLIVTGCGFLPNEWRLLSDPGNNTLFLPDYWLVFAPYMILLLLPALYYVVVMRRL